MLTAGLVGVFLALSSCAQVPEQRPRLQNPDFDRELTRLLNFSVPLLGVDSLYRHLQDYTLLDARTREEYEISHIPGSEFLGYPEADPEALKNLPKDQPLVLYCSVGYRSERMAERLRKQGFSKVYNLYGSIFEWANRGYPLENAQGVRTDSLHTYNRQWSRWVENPRVVRVW